MFASKDVFLKSSGGYTISRSVRLRSSASAYFNRTPASAGNRRTWTWSGWVKRGTLSARNIITQAEAGGNTNAVIEFLSDQLRFFQQVGGVDSFYLTTTQVFRDPSAWYHIVVVLDTTQATNTNRMKMYVNGVQVTSFASSLYPTQNFDGSFNNNVAQYIGAWLNVPAYFDGYLTEVNFIDGQALTPSSFGETNSITGVWQPKKFSGTYGTNGFYLNFSDNSSNTATTIGKDYSGNGNNWTPNNISVTAGVTYDSMVDSPTMGATSSNYATLNAVDLGYSATLSEANLKVSTASASNAASASTMALSTNTYWEVTIGSNSQVGLIWGRASDAYGNSSLSMFASGATGSLLNATRTLSATPSWSNGDTLGFAWNNSTRVLTLYQAGSATAVMTMTTPATGDPNVAITNYTSGAVMSSQVNFGQRPFSYTPPTGFKSLNTFNLPTPTISNGANYMAATTYTGTGATQAITNTVNGISFQPDLIWAKNRSSAANHNLINSVVGGSLSLQSNTTGGDNSILATSFNSNGFTLTATGAELNGSGSTYVGWQWKAGTTSSSNTNGSITSTVSANTTAGFSVVTFTGTGANATVGHGLGVAPSMVITKNRGSAGAWTIGFTYSGFTWTTDYFQFDTGAKRTDGAGTVFTTTPSSTVFSIGSNFSSSNFVAYCFAAVAGYSAFGSYTGNGSADGPFVYTGFRPRFILIKRTDTTGNWYIWDTSRDTYNVMTLELKPNLSTADDSNTDIDALSNGFKLRRGGVDQNASGGTYIYYAVAENPFKLSLAR
jgi:hypothetical protein